MGQAEMSGAVLISEESAPLRTRGMSFAVKTAIFSAQIVIVVVLSILWFGVEGVQTSRNLLVLFFYCFPSEFLISVVPHEPVMLYFAKFYPALLIASISIAGTLAAEALNYSVFKYVADREAFQKFSSKKLVGKTVAWFKRAPFLSLWVAGFTPIPFYPFRFLVVMARYPIWKYLLAVLTSRMPRFYLIALFGGAVDIPNWILLVLFLVLIVATNIPLIRGLLNDRQKERGRPADSSSGEFRS